MENFDENEENLFLKELNNEQKKAVSYIGGPQIISAGAGSGKTRVLTYKIAYLIKYKNISPYKILGLTFTKKAANEMKIRVANLINNKILSEKIRIGTFHSQFLYILRKNINEINTRYTKDFCIIEESDTKRRIKKILKSDKYYEKIKLKLWLNKNNRYFEDFDEKEIFKKMLRYHIEKISKMKSKGITYDKYNNNENFPYHVEDLKEEWEYFQNVYEEYEKGCEKDDVMDFDSILLYTYLLLKNNKNILCYYIKSYDYILVDEYQDTNLIQFEILKLLSCLKGNISIVGDENQSIYKFRGARIENIKDFIVDYPKHKLFTLQKNYRSTDIIVNCANALIKKNKSSFEKNLYSTNKSNEKIKIIENNHNFEEASKISYIINKLVKNNKFEFGDFAILYRANKQSVEFEQAFIRENIPYKIFKKISLFESKIIKIIINYIKLLVDLNDNSAFLYILNKPSRKIGKETEKKIINFSEIFNMSYFQALSNIIINKNGYSKYININRDIFKGLESFFYLILNYKTSLEKLSANEIILKLIEEINLKKALRYKESDTKKLNLFLEKIDEWEQDYKQNNKFFKIYNLLKQIELFVDINNLNNNKENEEDIMKSNKVKLMTIHSAKGLEFTNVFIVGVEEGYYPAFVNEGEISIDDIEEERRVFYVALTRAKQNCFISYCKNRKFGEKFKKRYISRFLSDIPSQYTEFYNDNDFVYISRKNKEKSENVFKINENQFKTTKFENQNFKIIENNINLIEDESNFIDDNIQSKENNKNIQQKGNNKLIKGKKQIDYFLQNK